MKPKKSHKYTPLKKDTVKESLSMLLIRYSVVDIRQFDYFSRKYFLFCSCIQMGSSGIQFSCIYTRKNFRMSDNKIEEEINGTDSVQQNENFIGKMLRQCKVVNVC